MNGVFISFYFCCKQNEKFQRLSSVLFIVLNFPFFSTITLSWKSETNFLRVESLFLLFSHFHIFCIVENNRHKFGLEKKFFLLLHEGR